MSIGEIKKGPCKIDGKSAFIRKVNTDTNVVCWIDCSIKFPGRNQCEKFESFAKRNVSYE